MFLFARKLILTVLLIITIFTTGFSPKANVSPRCSCKEDRQLALKNPYMSGADVKEIQQQLQNLGFYKGKTDGIYGPETAEAVKLFQKKYNLLADGILGFQTYNKLAKLFDVPVSLKPTTPPPGKVSIFIDTFERKLTILSDGKPYKEYSVAVGKWHTPTPLGVWKITQKAVWGEGFGSRWMRISVPWGIYGIHGTNKPWSIGNYASAGCIRMYNRHVEEIYRWVSIGTPVVIVGGPYGPFTSGFRTLVKEIGRAHV